MTASAGRGPSVSRFRVVAVRIANPDSGAPVQAGEIGVIEVKGPNVFAGYWRMQEKTAQEFRADGFFITGDLGRVDGQGYIHIVGRAKDLVITGGFNVYPKEVECEIDAIEGVLGERRVRRRPRRFRRGGDGGRSSRDPGAALTEPAILAALGGRLARFKSPKRVIIVESLPRNAMGKVQKAALPEDLYKDIYRSWTDPVTNSRRRPGGAPRRRLEGRSNATPVRR